MAINEFSKMIKDVFSNRNILSISLSSALFNFVGMAWRPFWPMYLKDNLGATVTIIGLLSAIQSVENMLFQLPGGLLADKYGRKKVIIWGTFLRTFSPIIYLFAPSWEWIILATIINGTMSLYTPAFNSLIADSMPRNRRGTGYGAYNMITSLPNIFSPTIGGIVMDNYGYEEGLKTFLILQILTSLLVTYIRWRFMKDISDSSETIKKKDLPSLNIVKDYPKNLKVMLVVAILGSISMRLVMNLGNLYALDILKLTNTQLGVITTVVGIISTIFALPSGMISDKYGRKNNIMLSRISNPITMMLIANTTSFEAYSFVRYANGLAMAIGGGGIAAGGPAWNALLADTVESSKLATVIGMQSTLSSLFGFPAGILGGWMWDALYPQAPYYLSGLVGMIAAVVFYFGFDDKNLEKLKSTSTESNIISFETINPVEETKKEDSNNSK
ncbi:MFS transporter [Candidatus Bathyarchaeota archaeon]|nr:MFS transporter [Candidatus Bathyarchaeota archaeon]